MTSWLVPRCVAQRPKPRTDNVHVICTRPGNVSQTNNEKSCTARRYSVYPIEHKRYAQIGPHDAYTVPGPQNPSRPTSSVSPQAVPSVIIAPKCDHIALIALQALSQAHLIKRLLSSRDLEDGALQVRPQVLGLLEPDAAPDEGGNQRSSEAIRGHQRSSGARAPRAQRCT